MSRGNCTWPDFDMKGGVPCGFRNETITQIPCCKAGDTCLSNNICKYTQSEPGGSGYYASGCTDGKFGHRSCSQRCGRQKYPDIVYVDNNIWKCCGFEDGVRQCDDPSDNSFEASPPEDLLTYWFAGQTNPPGPTATSTTTSDPNPTSTSTSTSPPDSNDSAGLSTGAKAGIGVGAGLGGLLVVTAVVLFIWRRRRMRSRAMPHPHPGPQPSEDMSKEPIAAGDRTPQYPVEAPASPPKNRKDSQEPAELPGNV